MAQGSGFGFDVYRCERGYVIAPDLLHLPLEVRRELERTPACGPLELDFMRLPGTWERVLDELEKRFYAVVSADEFAQMFRPVRSPHQRAPRTATGSAR